MRRLIILLFIPVFVVSCNSQNSIKIFKDVEYAQINGTKLLLDIYLPNAVENPNLLIWVHGGAWVGGDKENPPVKLVEKGYALASVNYRLATKAQFPAQVFDIKAAIRFLRAKASEYKYNAEKIVIAGSSAGGHLVALVGTTNNLPELEGTVGDYLNESSSVQGILDFYGPTNFMTILNQSTPYGMNVRVPALKKLLGDLPENKPELAKLASPVYHVDETDPPLLIMHGNKDQQVPINQSHELENEYKKHNLDVFFKVIYEGAHGGPEFETQENYDLVFKFLDKIFK
ncbi:Acetyl esterase/lipase [Flaviramulus basaltis]|uniref:Acetyl esterase/lipase n=1 Tax=Flaviramulus basaltis TaxID=369401 RepID=A0A1K2IK09_9FLAO|nr:alpha/beta hydrolase [Flaviramulus basaltis]SFZ92785.1 Acetyl esterase/lipase [Flaviramulus basaltis]